MTKSQQELLLTKIDKRLFKLTSIRHTFIRGIVAGLGSALGATIVLAIAVGVLLQIIKTAEKIPFLGGVVEKINIEEVIVPTPTNLN